MCLIATAVITACAFDSNVWARDIDSSPSPFPVPVLSVFLYDHLFACLRRETAKPNDTCQPDEESPPQIKPECELEGPGLQDLEIGNSDRSRKARSLPLGLVRVPGAAERRSSIVVSLGGR